MSAIVIGLAVVLWFALVGAPFVFAVERDKGKLIFASIAWLIFSITVTIVWLVGATSGNTHSWEGGKGQQTQCHYGMGGNAKSGYYQETICE